MIYSLYTVYTYIIDEYITTIKSKYKKTKKKKKKSFEAYVLRLPHGQLQVHGIQAPPRRTLLEDRVGVLTITSDLDPNI